MFERWFGWGNCFWGVCYRLFDIFLKFCIGYFLEFWNIMIIFGMLFYIDFF
jgi:hypothetical protein